MWEIIQLSHHDKLSDRLVTQLQHNFNTTSTFISTFISHFIQQSMKQFFNTFSSHTFTILPQQTIQDLVTNLSFTIYDAILYHKISSNLSFTIYDAILHHILHHIFITYFINKLSHIHLNKFHDNFIQM